MGAIVELVAEAIVQETGAKKHDEESSRWEVVAPLQSTRHRNTYLARSLRGDFGEHRVRLTVCRYEKRLLGNESYVENVRRRLRHETEMLALPLNFLPEPVDFFTCRNGQEKFGFPRGKRWSKEEPILVTEAFAGRPLDEWVLEDGPLAEERALRIGLRLCDMLADLHRWKVIAYELRPEDLLVDTTDHDRLWVASCANYQRLGSDGTVQPEDLVVPLSDFSFAAPEVEGGRKSLDRRSDIYSLGAVLHFLLTGKETRDLRVGRELPKIAGVGAVTQSLVRRCLAIDPRSRFPSATRLRKEIERALAPFEGRREAVATKSRVVAVTGAARRASAQSSRTASSIPVTDGSPVDLLKFAVLVVALPILLPVVILRRLFFDAPRAGR